MQEKLGIFVVFVLGTCIGSFLNVCIYRIPLKKSIVRPSSSCPSCGKQIPPYLNVPVVSYMFLRGRCANCGEPIPFRYPFVELLTGFFAAQLNVAYSFRPEFFVFFIFISALIVVTFIDLDHKLIPDVISLPGIAVGFAGSFLTRAPGPVNSAIGLALGAVVLTAVAGGYYLVTKKEGMGGGDIKLLAMIGAFVGWKGVIFTLIISSFIGSVIGIFMMMLHGKDSKYALPFGPFLAVSAVFYLFFGPGLIHLYLVKTGLY